MNLNHVGAADANPNGSTVPERITLSWPHKSLHNSNNIIQKLFPASLKQQARQRAGVAD